MKEITCTSQASNVEFNVYIDPDVNTCASQSSSVTRLLLDHVPQTSLLWIIKYCMHYLPFVNVKAHFCREKSYACYSWKNIGKKWFLRTKCKQYGKMDITSGSIVKKVKEDFELLMNGDTIN